MGEHLNTVPTHPDMAAPDTSTEDGAGTQRSVEPLADLSEPTSRVDSILNRWLVIVRTHAAPVHLAVAISLAGLGNAVIFATSIHIPTVLETISLKAVIVLISLAAPAIITACALRREFRAVRMLLAAGPGPATPILLRFVGESLEELRELLGDLRAGGALVDQEGVSEWVRRRCLVATKGRYVSSDSCTPTAFLERYSDLMKAHADYLERTKRTDSVRICVAPKHELLNDLRENPESVRKYVEWHDQNDVGLLYVDSTRAVELAKRRKLAGVVDWSFCLGEVAIAWEYVEAGLRLRLSFAGEATYLRCHAFLRDLLDKPTPFAAAVAELANVSSETS